MDTNESIIRKSREEMNEKEALRERIAKRLNDAINGEQMTAIQAADYILSDPSILIKEENQELPSNPYVNYYQGFGDIAGNQDCKEETVKHLAVEQYKAMLKGDKTGHWVKVVK
jgi:hypothetical protein